MRVLAAAAIMFAGVLLGACKNEIETNVFVSDLFDTMQGTVGIATVSLKIEVPTSDKCRSFAPKILEALRSLDANVNFKECQKISFSDYIVFSSKVSVIDNGKLKDAKLDGIYTVLVEKNDRNCSIGDCVVYNFGIRQNYKQDYVKNLVIAAIDDSSISLRTRVGYQFTVNIANDTSIQMYMRPAVASFINGVPNFGNLDEAVILNKRDAVEVVMSDVATESIVRGMNVGVAYLYHKK